jgi:hypothetical protein
MQTVNTASYSLRTASRASNQARVCTLDLSAEYKRCSRVRMRRIAMKTRTTKHSLKQMLLALCALTMVVLPAALAPSAFTQEGGSYKLRQSVIAGGGGASTNASTNLIGTIGQEVLGLSSGGAYSLNAGFWQSQPAGAVNISGNIPYCVSPTALPVPNVTLNLTGGASTSTSSDSAGNYQFTSLAAGASYTMTPTKTALPPASPGINTVDVMRAQSHFLNRILLTGCPLAAADANSDSTVNTVDVIAIQHFFLGLTTGIANVGQWRFSPPNRSYTSVPGNQANQNFDALLVGDTNGDLTPSSPTTKPSSAAPSAAITISLPKSAVGTNVTTFTLPVMTSAINGGDNLVGFQGDFTFDSSVVTFVNSATSKAGLTGGNWNVSSNVLGTGTIKTLRISAFSNDFTPLSGSGVLFNLNFVRVSSTIGASTALVWAVAPDDFIFIDTTLNTRIPGNIPAGSITIGAQPSATRLDQVAATGYDGGVFLQWQTGLESDNLGFNVYRDEGGKRELVNPQLVAGSALVADATLLTGRSYSWWDKSPGKGAAYWLEDIDLNGRSTWHGPFYAKQVSGAPPARSQAASLSEIATHIATTSSRAVEQVAAPARATTEQAVLQTELAGQAAVKLGIQHEGWYRLTQRELVAAGLDANVDPRFLRLFVEGREQPINVATGKDGRFDESAAIEFYGTGLDTPATDTRVYWLVADKTQGLRINPVKGDGIRNPDTSFPFTVERKDRTIYFSGLRNGDKENFFGAVITQASIDQTINVSHLDTTASGDARLEVTLQGVTLLTHLVRLRLNGTDVGQVLFNAQAEGATTLDIPLSLVKEGTNVVTLMAQNGPSDVSLADSIRLTYPHTYKADNDALRLMAQGNRMIRIDGFTSAAIRVVDITEPDSPHELVGQVEALKSGYAVSFAASEAGTRTVLAFADEQVKHPASIAANSPSKWRHSAQAADLLIVARRAFFSSLEPLKIARQMQGFKVALVDVEDIYDEFSFGEKTPQAVKDFFAYTRTMWKLAPRYVLLAGDASFDQRNYLGAGDFDLVPTKLVDTDFMETASDDWFADFRGDGLAEMATGRLPVRTAAEAAMMVAKILSYDHSTPTEGLLLVADSNDVYDFEAACSRLRGLVPPALRVEEIDRGRLDPVTAKNRLIESLNRGQKIVNYIGHGNVNQWRGDLLTSSDAISLTGAEQATVFVMMTCLNGYFHDPALDSLAESLMKVEKGGAVAVWASTGMALPDEQVAMNQQLYRLLLTASGPDAKPMTLGEAMLTAKASVSAIDIRRSWILFGDPTTRLR